ncbi:hypothetical protein ACWCYY_22885 [Kitasatospora sp. NPDC001664]
MKTGSIDRSDPEVIDLVLGEGDGSLRHAARGSLRAACAVPLLFGLGALLAFPVSAVMLFAGTGWGPVLVTTGIAGGLAVVVMTALYLHTVLFLEVHRLRLSPAPAPTAFTVVRGVRAVRRARPQPLTGLRHVRIDHTIVEPYDGDPSPGTVTRILTVLLEHGRIAPVHLPWGTDTAALHRELQEVLAPAVPVDLFVRRLRRKPLPPEDHHAGIPFGALGHGGSTGGGGS